MKDFTSYDHICGRHVRITVEVGQEIVTLAFTPLGVDSIPDSVTAGVRYDPGEDWEGDMRSIPWIPIEVKESSAKGLWRLSLAGHKRGRFTYLQITVKYGNQEETKLMSFRW